eukprot:TRINITY_DN30176_c0_g1_i1.p1 TRINITY_DN30176_c0_g1~~TRINITY_DN30176_c0_g1_i1.p1  ORF type:complete len:1071 (+),score=235.80 TRINITY_DN30176_c0_g1_i1:49-3213(+)
MSTKEVKEMKESSSDDTPSSNSALDLLFMASKKSNSKYSESQWVSLVDLLDRNWIDSADDLALVYQSGFSSVLRLPSELNSSLVKMLSAENAPVLINEPLSPISLRSEEGESPDVDVSSASAPIAPLEEFKEFVYSGDFDGLGIVHFLGTNFGLESWRNPVDRGLVKVRASSLEKDSVDVSALVGLKPVRLVTKGDANSWFEIDFSPRSICPTTYTLRHYNSWDFECLRNWRFEGSNDGLAWVTLREHVNDTSLNKAGQSCSWSLFVSQSSHFSRFRILQTEKNSSSHHYLALSGFEIYGKLKGGEGWMIMPSVPEVANIKSFRHSSDFDTNGLLYYLGSKGLSEPWRNPMDLGEVIVTASDLSHDSEKERFFVGRETVRLVTKNKDQSWFVVRFVNCRVQPSAYTLRHYSSWDTEVLRSWRFEGSQDGRNWDVIRVHENDNGLPNMKGSTHTWFVNSLQFYSHFRVIQTGKNSNNHWYLALSGFECYGEVEFLKEEKENSDLVQGSFKALLANSRILSFVHELDTNGLFYHIGTQEGSVAYSNPAESGLVKVSASGLDPKSSSLSEIVGRGHSSVLTSAVINSWIEFDLLDYNFCPVQFYLRNQFQDSSDGLRSWNLEGFDEENKSWSVLSSHSDDFHMDGKGSGHVWVCSRSPVAFYSRIRIVQTGPNLSGSLRFALSNVEFYGHVTKRSFKKSLSVAWDNECCSSNLEISGSTLINSGSNNSWQTCRLNSLFSRGVCEATFKFEKSPQTTNSWKASVGLVPQSFIPKGKLQWLGSQNSWAYIAGSGCKCNGSAVATPYGERFDEGDEITVFADFANGKVSFAKNGVTQGIAFTNLQDPVHPAVSLTATGSSFRIVSVKTQDGVYDPLLAASNGQIAERFFAPSPWGNVMTQDLFVNPENPSMVSNFFDQSKWEMVRSEVGWDLRKEKLVEFQFKIVEDPPTKNKWRFMMGVCPSTFKIGAKPPVWLEKGCWAYVAGTGGVFFEDVKNPEPYGPVLKKNDTLSVRLDCLAKRISFAVNGAYGPELQWRQLEGIVHAAVCMTAQNACVQLLTK